MSDPKPRMTKQRTAVLEVLQHGDFRSAQDWHERLRASGSPIGLATVYRALQALADTGDVDTVVTDTGETLYRRCTAGPVHHHHLRCRSCGTAEDIDMPTFEAWAESVASTHGFTQLEHTVELTGICAACAQKGR